MKQTLKEYTELARHTNRQLEKAYNKLEGPDLDKTVHDLLTDSGARIKKMVEELIVANEPSVVDTTNDNPECDPTLQELIKDLAEVIAGPLEFVFEDSESTMNEICNLKEKISSTLQN